MAKHREHFEKAFEGYRRECVFILEKNLTALKESKGHVVRFSEIPPENHSVDYERVIAMLGMSVDDTIELTSTEFANYVQDDWDWKQRWSLSNSKYIEQ